LFRVVFRGHKVLRLAALPGLRVALVKVGDWGCLVKAFCCDCGRPVRLTLGKGGKWLPGRCALHPAARRYSAGYAQKAFAAMRATVAAARVAVYVRPVRVVDPVEFVPMPKVREFAGGVA
jgi:hypothetical protein